MLCVWQIAMASPLLLRSRTDGGVVPSRTSRTTFLDRTTPPCPAVLSRVTALTAVSDRRMEPVQVYSVLDKPILGFRDCESPAGWSPLPD